MSNNGEAVRQQMRASKISPLILSLSLLPVIADDAPAQESLAGKTVTIYVGFGPGGGYDLYARLLARHMPRHLPGTPSMVVSYMPGAASVRAANYVYSVAPSDGTALGIVAQS